MTHHRAIPEPTRRAQHDASDPSRSVWVSANAGSGKTHVLAQRVMRLLLKDIAPGKILCLTFTKAAAANMAAKVFGTLAAWTLLDDAGLRRAIIETGAPAPSAADLIMGRRLFARTLETPGGLKIQTIHAFCERLLHLFPFEANVPARFDVLDELQQAELMALARKAALAEAARDDGALGSSLRRLAHETSGAEFDSLLKEALQHRSLEPRTTAARSAPALRAVLGLAADSSVATIERAMIEGGITPARWPEIAAILARGSTTDQKRADALGAARQAYDERGSNADAMGLCVATYLGIFFTQKDGPAKRLATKAIDMARPDIVAELQREQERLIALCIMRKAAATFERTQALSTVVDNVFARYDRIKSERGLLDFADLIERTLSLLQRSDAQWVLYKLDSGIDHILVDEAQDTSAPQWRIFETLTADFATGATSRAAGRSLFAVGDDKQSIFSFQGAAPRMFHDMRETFRRRFTAGGESFADIRLKASFRSVPGILEAVDRIFEAAEHQSGLVYDGDVWPIHEAINNHLPGLIEVWPPCKPEPEQDPADWRLPLDVRGSGDPAELAAQHVARKIAMLLADTSSEHVCDSDTGFLRPVRPSDILILVRTRGSFFAAVIRALKQAAVPVAGADRLILTDHIATMDLVAAGRVALLPQDDLTLACVLKSPLIGLNDDDLLAIAPNRPGSLYDALAASTADTHRRARATIDAWHDRAAASTPFGFYMRLLGVDGGRRAMERRLGPEACDAIDEFLRLSLQHEQEPAASLASFLASLEGIDLSIRRDMETTGDAVRVMTVHAAKGLEAKIVFLPDTCGAPNGRHDPRIFALPVAGADPVLAWSPRKDLDPPAIESARAAARQDASEEYRRLLYVALTRAEERLYIAGFHGAAGPQPGCWHAMIMAQLAAGYATAPAFWGGEAEILRRVTRGSVEVAAGVPGAAPEALAARLPDWLLTPAPAETVAPPPLRPSNALAAADRLEIGAAAAAAPRDALRRGRLIHVLLQHLPEVAAAQRHAAAGHFFAARAADLDAAARASLLADALAVIAAPPLAPLFGPHARAEVAIAGRLARGAAPPIEVTGRIDRMVETDAAVLIADFKSGLPPAGPTPAAYLTQMALYRAALAPLWPHKRLRMLLVWTGGPRIIELDDAALDAAVAALI